MTGLLLRFRSLLLLWYDVEIDRIARRLRTFVGILILEQTFEFFLGFRLNTAHTVFTVLRFWPIHSSYVLISFWGSTSRDLAPIMVFFILQMLLLQFLRANEA